MSASEKVRSLAQSYYELNVEERHTFAELVAPVDTSDVSGEWLEEISNRADDIDSGQVKLINGGEVLRQVI